MTDRLLYGIQQIGVGVTNNREARAWYAQHVHANIQVVEDREEATRMAPYTGGTPHSKLASIMLNASGGGGYELWQFTTRKPTERKALVVLGDLGINYTVLESQVEAGFFRDCYGNLIRVKKNPMAKTNRTGVKGCGIGVSDMSQSLDFYRLLGYESILSDEHLHDPEDSQTYRRVILAAPSRSNGRFGKFIGDSQLELIQSLDRKPNKTYEERYWGDPGYMHLCFEVFNLAAWRRHFKEHYGDFVLLSQEDFPMGKAKAQWSYIEDPDGTLIEMVETHKIPIIPGIFSLNLHRKDPHKPLPSFFIKLLSLTKSI